MLFLLIDSPQKLKLEKIHGTLIILYYVSLSSPPFKDFFFIKNTKNNHDSASDWWENSKSSFKKDTRTFSENIYYFRKILEC